MNIKINPLSIAVGVILASAISTNVLAKGNPHDKNLIGEEYEVSPEDLDKKFTKKDYDIMMSKFSDKIITTQEKSLSDKMSEGAQLVLIGEIINQSYTYDSSDVPTTHTTIKISSVLKGNNPSDEIVLTQKGGPRKDGDGGFIYSDTHFFSVGDEELLFLGIEPGDKLAIKSGYRVFQGQLYDEDGYGLIINANNIRLSKNRHPDESFSQINMGDHVLTKGFSSDDEQQDIILDEDGNNLDPHIETYIEEDDYLKAININSFVDMFKT